MITARYALEQNRDVFVIPANVRPGSEGSNGLLRSGAKAVLAAEDVLDEYAGAIPSGCFRRRRTAQMARPAAPGREGAFFKGIFCGCRNRLSGPRQNTADYRGSGSSNRTFRAAPVCCADRAGNRTKNSVLSRSAVCSDRNCIRIETRIPSGHTHLLKA